MLEWCNFSQPSPQMMAVFLFQLCQKIDYFYIKDIVYNNDKRQ